MGHAIGLDIGGTSIKAASFDRETGEVIQKLNAPTSEGADSFVAACSDLIAQLETEAGTSDLGIAAPGLVAPGSTSVTSMPGRLSGLEGLDWRDALKREVVLSNDAHAALLGEVWQGCATGCRNAILTTLGTGVGGAVLCDGQLLRGHLGRAGHLGHMTVDLDGPPDICGTLGSLEDFVGNHNIFQRSDGKFETTLQLIEAIREGDEFAIGVWAKSMRALGAAIVSFINLFDPEIVIIGGGISKGWDQIKPLLTQFLDQHEWRPAGSGVLLAKAALGEWAGAYGAARNAICS